MFPFTCPHCSHKSLSAGTPRCLYCRATGDDVQAQETKPPKDSELASGSRSHPLPKRKEMNNADRKNKNELNYLKPIDSEQAFERYRHETNGKDGRNKSTEQSQNGKNDGCKKTKNFRQMALDHRHSSDFQREILSNRQNHYEQIIASNISIPQSEANENAQSKIFCSRASKEASVSSHVDILDVQSVKNKQASNLSSSCILQQMTVEPAYKETSICSACGKDITKHVFVHEGKELYKCCVCRYQKGINTNLRNHFHYAREHFFCKICEETFKEQGSHSGEKTCSECGKTFQCKTFLIQHFMSHDSCPLCLQGIDEHSFEQQVSLCLFYKCCYKCCPIQCKNRQDIKVHFYSHIEEKALGCEVCGKRFKSFKGISMHKRVEHSEITE